MHAFKILKLNLRGLELPENVAVTDWKIENDHLLIKLSTDKQLVAEGEGFPTIYFTPISDEVLRLRVENKRLLADRGYLAQRLEEAEIRLGEMSDN